MLTLYCGFGAYNLRSGLSNNAGMDLIVDGCAKDLTRHAIAVRPLFRRRRAFVTGASLLANARKNCQMGKRKNVLEFQ